MKLRVWGSRGSIPTPMSTQELRERLQETLIRSRGLNLDDPAVIERFINRLPPHINSVVSGNTTCFDLRVNNQLFIFDMGSGMRLLGKELLSSEFGRGEGEAYIFITHTHWDHLEGFPFFVPAFINGNKFHFCSPYDDMEWRLRQLMRDPFFPVDLDYPRATRTYRKLEPEVVNNVVGVDVEFIKLVHPGVSHAYKLRFEGKTLVFATDAEYHAMSREDTAVYENFYRGADVLVFDAMYSFHDVVTEKIDWGHSTPKMGAELAIRAGVKKLILTHFDPASRPLELWDKVLDAYHHLMFRAHRAGQETTDVEVMLAYEGLTVEI